METDSRLNSIIIDEEILFLFIILNLFNFQADEFEKQYLFENNKEYLLKAKEISIFTLFTTLLIYIYFCYLNYKDLQNKIKQNKNTSLFETRLIGSILVVIGLSLLLYFRIKDRLNDNIDISENL